MENIVFLLTVLLRTGVFVLFSGILGSSALLLFLSVVSLDCCFCCCSSDDSVLCGDLDSYVMVKKRKLLEISGINQYFPKWKTLFFYLLYFYTLVC
jgi:hypothetical protein